VKLTALPGACVEGGLYCGVQAGVGIGGDQVGDADTAFFEGLEKEKFAPVDFGLAEGAGDVEDFAFAIASTHANGFGWLRRSDRPTVPNIL